MGVQVRWEGDGTKPAGEYTFFSGKGNENFELVTGILCIGVSYQQLRWFMPLHRIKLMMFAKFLKWHTEMLGDFSAKVGKEDIFKPTIVKES
jgi:hypothetical protein